MSRLVDKELIWRFAHTPMIRKFSGTTYPRELGKHDRIQEHQVFIAPSAVPPVHAIRR